MAHSSTQIFKVTSTTPKQGVSIYDVQAVFGVFTKNDIGALMQYITAHDLINVWAKYKPERNSKLGILTLADRQDDMFGLDIPVCTRPADLSTLINAYAAGYSYICPSGKSSIPSQSEWFRFDDFAGNAEYHGYNSDANCFVNMNDLTLPNEYIYGQNGGGLTFRMGLNTGASLHTDSISIDEIKMGGHAGTAFSDLYFGLLFVNGNTYKIVTSGYQLSDSGGQELHISESNNNGLDGLNTSLTYTVYPVLSVKFHTSSAVSFGQSDQVIALPLSPFGFSQKSVVQVQNISILVCSASMNGGVLLVDFVMSMSGSPSSMTAAYQVYEASYIGDTTGAAITGMSGSVQLSTSQNQNVQETRRMTNPNYVRVYVYNQNNSAVNTQAWAQVANEPQPV